MQRTVSGGLPDLAFGNPSTVSSEIYFAAQTRLAEVLAQKNPVYMVLDLPNTTTRVIVCFPTPGRVRVYVDSVDPEHLVGKTDDSGQHYPLPHEPIEYRFGMRLSPWMFWDYLDQARKCWIRQGNRQDNIVNYPVLSSVSGHGGALIRIMRVDDSAQREERKREWMKIYFFSTGNDFDFPTKWRGNPNTRRLARFFSEESGTTRLWRRAQDRDEK